MDKLKFKQSLVLVAFGIIFYQLLQNISPILGVFSALRVVVMPLLYGFVIAYMLNIPYKWYQDKVFASVKNRGGLAARMVKHLSVLLAYLTVLIIIVFLFWIILPQILTSVRLLVQNIPYYLNSAENLINRFVEDFELQNYYSGHLTGSWLTVLERYTGQIDELIPNLIDQVMNLTSIVFNLFIGVACSVYLIYSKETLIRQGKRLLRAYGPAKHNSRILELASRTNFLFTRFIAGNLLDSMIVGVLCFIGMSIFGFPYPLLVSVIIGVTNLIPIVGPFIGAVPGSLIILIVDPVKAALFLLFILVLQQIDGNIIKPRLFGNQVGLPSLWVLIAIVVGGRLFGIVGMLAGVPVVALIYSIVRENVDRKLANEPEELKSQ
ncbi:MAG: AI-2E family transporter [Clostridiaceae bacterium]|nr:AI-2E family transporter [Clostridiaceae bacterium]